MILLEMGPTIIAAGKDVAAACSEGLKQGAELAAGKVISDYLSGQSLKRRTGNLARAVQSWSITPFEVVIGVKEASAVDSYKWLLGDEQKTIIPKKGKFLTIPIGENLNPTGVAKFSSPRQVTDGFFVNKGGRLLFGYKKGKKGKFRALFVLVKSVFVQGSGALYDGVMDSLDQITDCMQKQIDGLD